MCACVASVHVLCILRSRHAQTHLKQATELAGEQVCVRAVLVYALLWCTRISVFARRVQSRDMSSQTFDSVREDTYVCITPPFAVGGYMHTE